MYELAIAIIGNGDTTYNNAADLLSDYLPENYIVYIPSYINSNGMKNVWKFLQDNEVNYERVKKSKLIETLAHCETKNRQLVILNPGGIENEISVCLETKIPVFDLCRGLFQVTDVPENGAGDNAETLSPDDPTPVRVEKDHEGESLPELSARVAALEKEVKKLSVMIGETNFEPAPLPAQVNEETATTGEEDIANGTVAYWKSKRGKYRKAGKSKARPGEELVNLTQEEIDKLE